MEAFARAGQGFSGPLEAAELFRNAATFPRLRDPQRTVLGDDESLHRRPMSALTFLVSTR
jgi:hypothetical protein